MWEGGGGFSEREGSKREVGEGGTGMYADIGNDGDGLRREEIVEGVEMGVRIGANVAVFGVEVDEEDVFVVTEET